MTQEDKELLLKDLCARLPYGVKVQIDLQSNIYPPISCKVCNIEFTENEGAFIGVETSPDTYNEFREFLCKPYLFPLSSMTEEQKIECFKGTPLEIDKYGDIAVKDDFYGNSQYTDLEIYLEVIDWLNKKHFDYRELIPMGLAIDATGLNIY